MRQIATCNKYQYNATFLLALTAQKFEAFSLGGLTYHLLLPLSTATAGSVESATKCTSMATLRTV